MKYNRLLPLLIPILILILFEVFFFYPGMFYVSLVLANLLIFFAITQFSKASNADKERWNYLILPVCLVTSLAVYSTLLTNKIIVQTLFVLNIVLLYYYLRSVYYYLIYPAGYTPGTIENFSSFANLLVIFWSASVIYGFQSFLNLPIWLLIIVMLAAASLVIYQVLWSNKIDIKKSLIYILVGCLILVELSWAASFLPFNYNITGLIIAICYYMLIGLIRFYLLNKLDKKVVRFYLGLGLSSIILIILTAQWL